jgi:hypothetical protein
MVKKSSWYATLLNVSVEQRFHENSKLQDIGPEKKSKTHYIDDKIVKVFDCKESMLND